MADHQIVIAGFGGQGLLFSGKVLAYAGLIEGRELSWLPSYGPDTRTDVEVYYVPATKMAMDMGMPTLANMILLGALIAKTGCVREESLADALHKVIPARKADLFDLNMQALQAGKEFAG